MNEIAVSSESPFDGLMGEDGRWSARGLQQLMGYARFEDFKRIVERAKQSAANSGHDAEDSFSVITERVVTSGNTPDVQRVDYRLTRHAAYLTAMNGDPNKAEVAAAQAYFAAKTREAEVRKDLSPLEILKQQVALMEEQEARTRRLEARQAVVEAKVSAIEGEYDEFTALAYAKLHDLPTGRPYLSRLGKEATRLMREDGEQPHKRQDATFGSINVYPARYLEQAAETVS
jgi:DNA-damage-inducible protein D